MIWANPILAADIHEFPAPSVAWRHKDTHHTFLQDASLLNG